MVRTMSLLRALISTARMVRHTPRLADGLPPDGEVLLDAPDDRLGPALVAAALGDHGPAAKLLATTRETAEWENRDRYVTRLAAFAYGRGDWLDDWLATAPGDADALLVRAELAMRRAWESPARAERLREVGPLIEAAAEAGPRDPVPWRLALDHARGTHATHTTFESLWEQAVRRSSHHFGAHVAALQYLSAVCCARWGDTPHTPGDSHRECFDFAERAAEDALPGSLVQALPVRAAFDRLLTGGPGSVAADRVDAAADRAIALSAAYRPTDPWPAEVRNLLVYVLIARGRWAEALEQFRLTGPYATSFPWSCLTDDPLGRFLEARDGVRIEIAASMPLRPARQSFLNRPNRANRGRAGQSRSGGHYA
ncbi:hypothetical protein [Streptomyces sp. NPDC000410]|uniref:hypothetical protein n=1 Tax=Streptomyces sp. NPDC000410 TaxID=3154254 RepID=UPI00332FB546